MSTNRNPTTERRFTGKPGRIEARPRRPINNEIGNAEIVRAACDAFLLKRGQVPAREFFRGNFGRNAE